jgi:hypothetical protein
MPPHWEGHRRVGASAAMSLHRRKTPWQSENTESEWLTTREGLAAFVVGLLPSRAQGLPTPATKLTLRKRFEDAAKRASKDAPHPKLLKQHQNLSWGPNFSRCFPSHEATVVEPVNQGCCSHRLPTLCRTRKFQPCWSNPPRSDARQVILRCCCHKCRPSTLSRTALAIASMPAAAVRCKKLTQQHEDDPWSPTRRPLPQTWGSNPLHALCMTGLSRRPKQPWQGTGITATERDLKRRRLQGGNDANGTTVARPDRTGFSPWDQSAAEV